MVHPKNSIAPLLLQAASGANKHSTVPGARYSVVAEFICDYRLMRKRLEGRGWLPIIIIAEIDHPQFSRAINASKVFGDGHCLRLDGLAKELGSRIWTGR
jgi:hypothetical protein